MTLDTAKEKKMEYLNLVKKLFEYRVTWLGLGLSAGNEYTVDLIVWLVGLI